MLARTVSGVLVVMLGLGVLAATATAAVGDDPRARRTDHGALIVLDLYGSYEAMGRQEVALLGATSRELGELYGDRWRGLVQAQGMLGSFMNGMVLPVWATFGGWREDSGFFEEAAGIAAGLDARGTDGVRYLYGGVFGGGSTVFAATGKATADGRPIIGRNVDWADDTGRRRPVVARYHPDNGDLTYLSVSWPLIIVPIVGLNEAGLAVSINFFDADDMIGLGFPRILYRRILQRARTVEEALALLTEGGNRGGAGILVLADAGGALALAECAARHCAIHRPTEDWLGQSNHTRTAEMHAHDEGRTADSDRRRQAMEAAVQRHLGRITPEVAAEILRDRSNSPFINDATVANLRVLNTVVVDPERRLLWHSIAQQPLAPFGAMVPLAVGDAPPTAPMLAADPRLDGPALQGQVATVAAMRQASRLFAGGRVGDAGAIWDRLAADATTGLEPRRLAWARARVRWSVGRLGEAEALLADADVAAAPFEVQAYAKVARGMIADRRDRRDEALAHYRGAARVLEAHPDYDARLLVAPVRRWIAEGLAAPTGVGRLPAMPDLQCIPQ